MADDDLILINFRLKGNIAAVAGAINFHRSTVLMIRNAFAHGAFIAISP